MRPVTRGDILQYCQNVRRTVRSINGSEVNTMSRIYMPQDTPIVNVSVSYITTQDYPSNDTFDTSEFAPEDLFATYLNEKLLDDPLKEQRVIVSPGGLSMHGKEEVFTVYFLKPNRLRYWSDTMAQHDAKEIIEYLESGI